MKTLLSSLVAIFLFSTVSRAQVSVPSTNGYSVNISITPLAIIPSSSSCAWGYNYNVSIKYSVNFVGSNIPASLYTLQGTLGCGTSGHFFDLPNNGGTGTVTSVSNVWTSQTNCATATVTSMSCTDVSIQIEGPGITSRTITFPASAALPVKLVDFSASATQKEVTLNWATLSEVNYDRFSIERSADGINWNSIGTVNGAGNSSTRKNYQFTDRLPLTAAYYRLKQIDIDGSFEYSLVQFARSRSGSGAITVFPVPNAGQSIQFAGLNEIRNWKLVVLSNTGIQVHQTQLSSNSVQLPVLKAGTYILQLKNEVSGEQTNLRYVQL